MVAKGRGVSFRGQESVLRSHVVTALTLWIQTTAAYTPKGRRSWDARQIAMKLTPTGRRTQTSLCVYVHTVGLSAELVSATHLLART